MPYQMKDGCWRASKTIEGQRKTKVFGTKTEAKKWEATQDINDWKKETLTVCLLDVVTAYLDYSRARHHPTTYKDKKSAFKRLFARMKADAMPEDLTRRFALAFMMNRSREAGNTAANKDRKHLSAFWEWAVKFYNFPDNPFKNIDRLPENSQPHYVPPVEDFWKIYAIADDTDKAMLLCLLYTAGRRSEPLRWTWEDDVDLTERRIRLSTCKTADGSRKYEWLSMPKKLHDALVNHKLRTGGHGHVFVSKNSGDAYHCRKHFITRLCERAGVRKFNYHGIRGLCASLLAAEGVPMKEIQHVLMHSSMTTTDRYIRRIGGTSDILATAFDNFEKTKMAGKVVPFSAMG